MKKNLPVTGKEFDYSDHAVIISTTDLKGSITYVNNDFVDISGFKEDELIGRNHNIIRHPDMPPAAFEDLWSTVKRGESWRGIVKNRCKNGDHYWVEAYVTPVLEDGQVVGYQSVRSRPERDQVARAEALYARLNSGSISSLPKGVSLFDISLKLRIGAAFMLLILINLVGYALTLVAPGVSGAIAIGTTAAIIVVAAISWYLLQRTVIRPVVDMIDIAKGIAQGDLTTRITISGNDEVNQMRQALKMMQARLQTVIGRLTEHSQNVAAAAEELASRAAGSSRFMNQQRQETEQVATAMNEMVATVQEVSRNIVATADAAREADEQSARGREVVLETLQVIERLVERIGYSVEAVHRLQEDGRNIANIMSVIRGIAEQTNLLALNAAIEAARAGDVGRGFAVVADEVRTLASRTQSATHEISEVIGHLESGIDGTVEAMNEVRERAEDARGNARSMGGALDEVTASVTRISDMSDQIATASTQQSSVTEEVNRNVVRIHELSEDTAIESDRSRESGQQLAELASELQRLASSFNTGGGIGDFDFSQAKQAHLEWRRRARALLDGDDGALSIDQAVSHKSCALGKWYYSAGLSRFGGVEGMRDIEQPHAELHRKVREIIEYKRLGRMHDAENTYRDVEQLSGRIVSLLDSVARRVEQHGHKTGA
jgi:aerotaxis receptor